MTKHISITFLPLQTLNEQLIVLTFASGSLLCTKSFKKFSLKNKVKLASLTSTYLHTWSKILQVVLENQYKKNTFCTIPMKNYSSGILYAKIWIIKEAINMKLKQHSF